MQNPEEHNRMLHALGVPVNLNHLMEEIPLDLELLEGKLTQISELEREAGYLAENIKKHASSCGECIKLQMQVGALIPIADYWEMRENMGGGYFPKNIESVN